MTAEQRRLLLEGCVGPDRGASIVVGQQVALVDALLERAREERRELVDLSLRAERTRLLRGTGARR